jgi:hypothetical protein
VNQYPIADFGHPAALLHSGIEDPEEERSLAAAF